MTSELPEQTRDDTDEGWGDRCDEEPVADPDIARLERERPPHHDRD